MRPGKELIGLCPFHKDTNPSLNIDPVKNVWDCKGACGTGGSVIDWVMRAEGISTRYALELLSRDLVPLASPSAAPPPKQSTVPKLPPLFAPTVDDQQALKIVVNYYHETLKNSPDSPKAKQYLVQRGLESSEMIERFRLAFPTARSTTTCPTKTAPQARRYAGDWKSWASCARTRRGCDRELTTTCIFRGRCAECGTKKRSSPRKKSSCAKR
jgi:DNA primase